MIAHQQLIESPPSNDWGISIDTAVNHWWSLNSPLISYYGLTVTDVKAVAQKCQDMGISYVWFLAYTIAEGSNGNYGWINNTWRSNDFMIQAIGDIQTMLTWSSTTTLDSSAGLDVGNPYYQSPQSALDEAQNWLNTAPNPCIGRAYINMTAAAFWALFDPNALNGSVNGVQNYGDPFNVIEQFITDCGGSINTNDNPSGTPITPPPSKPNNPPQVTTPVGKTARVFIRNNEAIIYGDNGTTRGLRISTDLWEFSTTVFGGSNNNPNASTPTPPISPPIVTPVTPPIDSGNGVNYYDTYIAPNIGQSGIYDYECYALVSWYIWKISGYQVSYATQTMYGGTMLRAIGDTGGGGTLWSAWDFSPLGWSVIANPTYDQIAKGDIVSIVGGGLSQQWGHTGICISVSASGIYLADQWAQAPYIHSSYYDFPTHTVTGIVRPR